MKNINYAQIYKEDRCLCETARELWVPFIKEMRGHEGKDTDEAEIAEGLEKRIAIQGSRKDMHFEVMFL